MTDKLLYRPRLPDFAVYVVYLEIGGFLMACFIFIIDLAAMPVCRIVIFFESAGALKCPPIYGNNF